MSTTDKTTASAPTAPVPEWDYIPCIQYGFSGDEKPVRSPELRTIFEPVPDDATTVSPVYGLTSDQYQYHERLDNPYQVKHYTSVATKLQDQCEGHGHVLYPIHIESDVYREQGPATLIEWFREFVEDYLGVPFYSCRLYFSGNRSIHVHVPRFVVGEQDRERLKELAETFCEETGAKLDCGLYYAKRMFRLPGVKHGKTGLQKVEIEPEWGHDRIIREAATSTTGVPESYEALLRRVFLRPPLMKDTAQPTAYTPHALFRVLDSDKTVLEFETDERKIETPLIERRDPPTDASASEMKQWAMYRAKEFSPYALANGNGHSVAVVKVKGTPFARDDVTIGNSSRPVYALIPAYFYGARGCAGGEFTKDHQHAPLQLSKPDYEKWEKRCFQPDDHIIIIGGKSNSSVIFRVDSLQATIAGHALTGEGASRQAALDYLQGEGYDVGKAGTSGKATPSKTAGTRRRGGNSPRGGPETEAAKLQRQAERHGVDTLGFTELSNVANRLLRIGGWSLAWEWCENQFGEQFDPEITWKHLKGIVECYDDLNVEVPPKLR